MKETKCLTPVTISRGRSWRCNRLLNRLPDGLCDRLRERLCDRWRYRLRDRGTWRFTSSGINRNFCAIKKLTSKEEQTCTNRKAGNEQRTTMILNQLYLCHLPAREIPYLYRLWGSRGKCNHPSLP